MNDNWLRKYEIKIEELIFSRIFLKIDKFYSAFVYIQFQAARPPAATAEQFIFSSAAEWELIFFIFC